MINDDPYKDISLAADNILKHKADSLEVIPAVALKLLQLTNDDNTDIADLSLVIETEPSLTAKVLRNVNSAAFALTHKITSIKRAVNLLGFSAVRQLALNQIFYNKLIQHHKKNEFNSLFFWQHCLFVASLSRAIATTLKYEDPDLIYAAGLIHDIGKITLESHGKVSYSEFMTASKNDTQSTLLGEHDFFGLNHAEMGFIFCQQWDIPEQISAIVYCHHKMPNRDSPFSAYAKEIAIVSFANYIAWIQGIGSTSKHCLPELDPRVSEHLEFNKLDLEFLLKHVDQEMMLTREFYGIKFPNINKLRSSLIETTMLLSSYNQQQTSPPAVTPKLSINCLTTPHKSLIPNEIIPWTLEAIQSEFKFDRLIILNINSKKRNLLASYCWPESFKPQSLYYFNISIENLPKTLLKSLRERKAIIINQSERSNEGILTQFKISEFLIVPILDKNKLVALFYADNYKQNQPIPTHCIAEITPIIHELSIALEHAKCFDLEKKKAEIDPLTGLMNKRMIHTYLTKTFQLSDNQLKHTAIGFIDIDFFKSFNDTCGHQAGDDVLKIVAQILHSLTRPNDFIGRYGGEEFVFILHNTSRKGAFSFSERIRLEIERKGKILSQRFKGNALTISIGVCLYQEKYTHFEQMIELADKAMYKAKKNGRNQVVIM